jgi:hypothetical protein
MQRFQGPRQEHFRGLGQEEAAAEVQEQRHL